MAEFKTGVIWGIDLKSKTGKALTASFEASDTDPIVLHGPVDLVCTAEVQVDPADSVELRFDFLLGDGIDWTMPGLVNTSSGPQFTSQVWKLQGGAVGTYSFNIQIPWACTFQLMARGVGVGAGTLLRIIGESRGLGDGGGGGGGVLAAIGGSVDAINGAFDEVTGTVLTTEQAGPETVLNGETLFDVTNGADGTYNYYFEHDGFKTFTLQLILDNGSGPGNSIKVWATEQDDGTPIASRAYDNDVTNSVFGYATITSSGRYSDNAGKLRDAKSIRVTNTVDTGGANDADWTGYLKQSY